MAILSLTIPAEKVEAVIAAIEHTGCERLENENDRDYAIRYIVEHLKERHLVYRKDTAGADIVSDNDLIGGTP